MKKVFITIFIFLTLLNNLAFANDRILAVGDRAYPPLIYLDEKLNPRGFDIEVLNEIEKRTNIKFDILLMNWDNAVKTMENNENAILIGMSKNNQREKRYLFSKPYLISKTVIFTLKDVFHINNVDDLRGRRIGVQRGSLAYEYLIKNYSKESIYAYDDFPTAFQELKKRNIDAILGNYYVGLYYINKYGYENNIKAIGKPILETEYCYAFKMKNAKLKEKIDKAIESMQKDGTIKQITDSYFGVDYFESVLIREKIFYYVKIVAATIGLIFLFLLVFIYILRIRIKKATLELTNKNKQILKAYEDTIRGLFKALEKKEEHTANHSINVNKYAMQIAERLDLSEQELVALNWGSLLHDIGKLAIPEYILLKPDKLTDEEYKIIKEHTLAGFDIIKDIEYLKDATVIIKYHHERYDGNGYPEGLKGDEIPFIARICAVADAYDAMTQNRPYRKAMLKEEAITELIKNSGTQFDPIIVDIFVKILEGEA
ncbi:transporter substrate-binding domain-containing protein [Caldicellulosiruptoraceae bacterium PP1]